MPPWYLWGRRRAPSRHCRPWSGCGRCPAKSHWAEILVARRVEQVEGEPFVLEAHHRRGDRDAAPALDRHPIRAHPPPLALRLDLARQLYRPAKQQQFLGQGGLAGVGMRDDRKGPPAQNLVGQGAHARFRHSSEEVTQNKPKQLSLRAKRSNLVPLVLT